MTPSLMRIALMIDVDKDRSGNSKFVSTCVRRYLMIKRYESSVQLDNLECSNKMAYWEADDSPDCLLRTRLPHADMEPTTVLGLN